MNNVIRIFSFAASCAGERSKTAAFSARLAQVFTEIAEKEGLRVEYEQMTGADLRLNYCRSCESCFMKGVCPLDEQDDGALLKQKILDADIFFFGSPVYLWQMSGIAKTVLDRISYWAHRFELIGKPCAVFSTTDSSHGPEVAAELHKLLGFTGAVVVNAGTCDYRGPGIDPLITAEKLLQVWKDPASGVGVLQQSAFLGRVVITRKYFKAYQEEKGDPVDEMRVFRERGLDRYVLLKEAIQELIHPGP